MCILSFDFQLKMLLSLEKAFTCENNITHDIVRVFSGECSHELITFFLWCFTCGAQKSTKSIAAVQKCF